jgi:hypothetical protein
MQSSSGLISSPSSHSIGRAQSLELAVSFGYTQSSLVIKTKPITEFETENTAKTSMTKNAAAL